MKRKLEHSEYISGARPAAKELLDRALTLFDFASVLFIDSRGKNYRVSASGVSVSDEPLFCSRGMVLRFAKDGRIGEISRPELSEEDIDGILDKARELLSQEGDFLEYLPCEEVSCTLSECTEFEEDPELVGDGEIIRTLKEVRSSALGADPRVFDCMCRLSYKKYTKLFLSRQKDMCESVMWTTAAINTFTKENGRIRDSYRGYSNLGGTEILKKLGDEGVSESVRCAVDLLRSEQIPAGEYDCICSPDVTGMIVHEAFGHGVEMDMFVRDRALARDYIGERVASDKVNMHDSACAVSEAASYFFDDEGNLSRDTKIISNGILLRGICDEISASRLGTSPTGNGRRESSDRRAYTRMTNTYFEAGEDSLEDMIASVKHGFLLEEARNGMEDPKNWGIQCVVGIAREISDGALTGRIFSPVVLSGYVPDLLRSIRMTGRDFTLSGCGFCGKGHKEWVKVSDGGPYILARIKLG